MSVEADDRDPNTSYFGSWLLLSTGNAAIHQGTMSQTNQVSAGLTFKFTGTQISVFGVVRPLPAGSVPPISTYKLDGMDAVTYTAPNLTASEGDSMLFYSSDSLAAAQHTLLINVTRVSPEAPYLLDYFTYLPVKSAAPSPSPSPSPTPNDPPPPASPSPTPTPSPTPVAPSVAPPVVSSAPLSSASPSSSSSSSSQPSSSGSSVSSQLSPPQTAVQGQSSAPAPSPVSSSSLAVGGTGLPEGANTSVRTSNHTGAIAGGVIGGVLLLVLIIVGAVIWRRRRRNTPGSIQEYVESPPTSPATREVFSRPGITPFMLPSNQPTGGARGYADPFQSPADPPITEDSSALPYTMPPHAKSRTPERFTPNRYNEMSMSTDASVSTPPESAYAPSTEPSERFIRTGPSSTGHTSSQGSRLGPLGPRDDVKGSVSGVRPLPARPAAQHADSGMRFAPPPRPPPTVMSEVMSEIPPAYTFN